MTNLFDFSAIFSRANDEDFHGKIADTKRTAARYEYRAAALRLVGAGVVVVVVVLGFSLTASPAAGYLTSNSAIWMVLSAAPLRRLSPDTTRLRPLLPSID